MVQNTKEKILFSAEIRSSSRPLISYRLIFSTFLFFSLESFVRQNLVQYLIINRTVIKKAIALDILVLKNVLFSLYTRKMARIGTERLPSLHS